MSIIDRINSLKQKHATLETQLEEAMKGSSSDEKTINDLKRQKLSVKDEIERLSRDT